MDLGFGDFAQSLVSNQMLECKKIAVLASIYTFRVKIPANHEGDIQTYFGTGKCVCLKCEIIRAIDLPRQLSL